MASPEPYQVAFENEYVRIVHVNLARGQTPPAYTPVSLPLVRVDLNSKRTHYCATAPDDAASAKLSAVREIRVELKPAPETAPSKLDAVRVDPARYKVDFENDRVRIVRLGFGPRERGLMVMHPPRVLVTLTDVSVKLVFSDGRTDERGAPAGVAAWLDAETLQTENAASVPLEVVLVEPKSTRGF
jgi:hypothetical protein